MKRTLLLKSVLSMMLLGMGLNAWSVETPYKTLTFSASTNGASVGSYTKTWTATIDDFTWELVNFNNNNNGWAFVKCGRKDNPSVGTITTASAIDEAITKVVVTVDAVTSDYVNSTYLEVASDADFTSPKKIEVSLVKGENTYTVATPSANQYYRLSFDCASAKSNGVIQISKVEYYYSSNKTTTTASFPAASYTLRKGDGIEAPQVSIKPAAAASDGTITYSIDKESVATIDKNSGELTIVGAGTAKVTAKYTGSDKYEDCEASYTLTVYENSYYKIEDLQKNVTSESTPIMFTFNDIYVTAVKGSNAYISDGTYGALIYTSGHGLTAGNVINGSAVVNLVLYNGQTEITNFPKEGLDIKEATLTPTEADFEIAKENQSALVTIPNAVYSDGVLTYDYGTIKYYDNFSTKVSLEEGKTYNVTGIVVVHIDDIEICPRTAADVEEIASGKTEPTLSASYKESLNVDETDSYTVTYDGNGTLSATSSNTDVATVEISGKNVTVTAKAVGTTMITISATETATYEAVSINYNLQVSEEGVSTVEWIASVLGDATITHNEGWVTQFNDDISAYWDSSKGTKPGYNKDGTARLYMNGGFVKISAKVGYAITSISLVCSGTKVGYNTSANVGTYETSGSVGSWSGLSPNVTITNNADKDNNVQMQIKSITVTYVPLTETGKTVTIPSSGKATFTPDADCIIGDGTVSKYITGLEENGYTLVEEDAPVVAEGEGVLLTGKPGDEYKLYTHTSLSADKNERNKLVGAIKTTFAPIDSYVLQDKGNGPRFYHVGKANNFDINGHAYLSEKILEGEEASGVKVLYFAGDDATAIEEVNEIAETEGAIYNLQGVQVNSSYKGIVIRGGKKFLNK